MAHATKTNSHHFKTHIDINEGARDHLVEMLDRDLACTFDLMSQVKQAHWNVKGKQFYPLHLLFDEIAGELLGFVDDLAERITSLGGYAHGTTRMAAEHSCLPEYPTGIVDGPEHVAALVERFGVYAGRLRTAIGESEHSGDPTTSDLYIEISRAVDKRLWFLEAHLQA